MEAEVIDAKPVESGNEIQTIGWRCAIGLGRGARVKHMLSRMGHDLHCFKLCQNGEPYHPLYMASETKLILFT